MGVRMRITTFSRVLALLVLPAAALAACSDDDSGGGSDAGTGGKSSSTGGKSSTGGARATGGASSSTGGSGAGAGPASGGSGGGTGTGGSDTDGGDGGPAPYSEAVSPDAIINAFSTTGHDRFYGVTTDAAGNFYAVGQISDSVATTADFSMLLVKFKKDGSLDPSFGDKGVVKRNVVPGAAAGELYRGVALQSTGKVVVLGNAEHPGATDARDRAIVLLRFNTDGTKDTTWGKDGIVTLDLSDGVVNGTSYSADSAWGLAVYDDDRLIATGGQVRKGALDTDFVMLRLEADGTLDDTFGTKGVFSLDTKIDGNSNNASPRNPTILPNGEGVLGAGYQPIPGADTGPVLYKVKNDGTLDTSFATNGVFSDRPFTEQTETYQAVVQPEEAGDAGDAGHTGYKIVTTGYGRQLDTETTDVVSLRLTSDGKIDETYATRGILRLDIGGFADNSRRVLILPDRRIVLLGGGRKTAANVDGLVVMLTPDGAPDKSFSPVGWNTYGLGGPADFFWSGVLSKDAKTLGVVGIKGVGTAPVPATANDDTALLILSVPQ
jgi:uncharacterized delta-60 repeat protein